MDGKPFISIIIPTLNEESFLPRLLDDLAKQKYKNFEVIVVDGGSKDRTIEKANKYLGSLSLTIIQNGKGNVSRQRNIGAKQANGKYLIFFDADVQLLSRYLLMLNTEIIKNHPNFFTTYVKADSQTVSDQIIASGTNLLADLSILVERQFAGGWNFGIKRQIFEKIKGFREDVVHGEDSELSLRLFKAGFRLRIFKNPILIYSLRRFRREGTLEVIKKQLRSELHQMTKGPITKQIFEYQMGGKYDKKKIKPNFFEQADEYLKKLRKMLED